MKTILLIVCALIFAAAAQARPQVIEETWTISPPDDSWTYFGRFVAVDTSWALVQGDRFVPDPEAEGGTRHDGAALLYEKVGTNWVYRGVLGAIEAIDEWTKPGFAMKNGVAMVIEKTPRIFERNGSTWTQVAANIPDVQGPDIEIINGKILVPRVACTWDAVVLSKATGIWDVEGQLQGNQHECGDNPPTPRLDMDIRRAAIFNELDSEALLDPVIKLFQPSTQGGAPGWEQVAEIPQPEGTTTFGPDITMRGANIMVTGSRESGTLVFRELNQVWGQFVENMNPVDGGLQPAAFSAVSLEHNSQYYFQRNYSYDRKAYVINVFTVEVAHVMERQRLTHRASLVARRGGSLDGVVDISGNRVIVSGRNGFTGDNTVRVFDMPAALSFKTFRVDNFEGQDNFFDWNTTPGSQFLVTAVGANRVWRQSSTAGDAASFLPSTETTDQAIEAEVTPIRFNGADRWVGLMTRRADAANYYYVTARSSGSVQLRKIVGGTFSTLASVTYDVAAGRKLRLRLESIGTALRVYIDGRQAITAFDTSLTHGQSGVATYRASADFDNVMLSQGPQASIFVSNFSATDTLPWTNDFGSWRQSDGVYRQTDLVTPNSRAIAGAMSDEQVVQARVKITGFGAGNPWVGLIAKYTDAQNYTYVTLRKSGVISLRYLVDGAIYSAGEANYPVIPGTWYKLRYEGVGFHSRVFVNDQLVLQGNPTAGQKGRVGLMTYRATAEFDDFTAYQP